MILQALYEYYQRKAADPVSTIAPRGLEWKEIPYLILIDKKGNFLEIVFQIEPLPNILGKGHRDNNKKK